MNPLVSVIRILPDILLPTLAGGLARLAMRLASHDASPGVEWVNRWSTTLAGSRAKAIASHSRFLEPVHAQSQEVFEGKVSPDVIDSLSLAGRSSSLIQSLGSE